MMDVSCQPCFLLSLAFYQGLCYQHTHCNNTYLESANYNQLAYSNSTDPVSIALNIQYDNAVQSPQGTGIGTAIGRTANTLVTGGGA